MVRIAAYMDSYKVTVATTKVSFHWIWPTPPPSGARLVIADWLPTLLFATLAAVPWLPWSNRFSLRTLLIATTLVAVVLGLIVWAVH